LTLERVGRTHDGQKQLFSDVSITIQRGQKLAVVGPNGCGKTMLLRLIAGVLLHATSCKSLSRAGHATACELF
jgi:ABC-type transport system involved in cytochrome c biogenesis ATPase subunit